MDEAPRNGPDQKEGPEEAWHSYRCPVCGHTDGVAKAERGPLTIPCSHCQTMLEVHVSPEGVERTTVHVHREETGE